MVKFLYRSDEALYKGVYVPLRLLKEKVKDEYPGMVHDHQIYKTFNKNTGEIDRKYAWDSIFYKLTKNKKIYKILDKLI